MKVLKLQDNDNVQDLVNETAKSLKQGNVIALPTDTIYGIAALAQSTVAVNQLYDIKERHQEKPVAICVGNIEDIKRWGQVTVSDELLHDLLPGPVTLVFKRANELNAGLNPGNERVGIRIPDHSFVRQLALACQEPMALTSANKSSGMSTLRIEEFSVLWPKLDVIVDGGVINPTQECRLGSTVVDLSKTGQFAVIREGSAYQETVQTLERHGLLQS